MLKFPLALQHASTELKKDVRLVSQLIEHSSPTALPTLLALADRSIGQSKAIALQVAGMRPSIIYLFHERLRQDADVVRALIRSLKELPRLEPSRLLDDEKFLLAAARIDPSVGLVASSRLQNSPSFREAYAKLVDA